MSTPLVQDTPIDPGDSEAALEAARYEPVDVTARFEAPRADIDRDTSKSWFARLMPILMVNKWAFGLLLQLLL